MTDLMRIGTGDLDRSGCIAVQQNQSCEAAMVFKQRRSRSLLFFGLAIMLCGACGFATIVGGETVPISSGTDVVLGAGFCLFGLGAFVNGYLVICPASLVIEEGGFTEHFLWRRRFRRWQDAERFHVWGGNGNRFIGYDDNRPKGAHHVMRSLNKALGAEGYLREEWGSRANEIAQALNTARDRWRESDQHSPGPSPETDGESQLVGDVPIVPRQGESSRDKPAP